MTSPDLKFEYDAYAHYARHLMITALPELSPIISPSFTQEASLRATSPKDPVGIIGAGPGGLYAALILSDLGIPFKVIEARGSVGGRLFTYAFPNGTGAPYNYFDVGAMRFPRIKSMARIFHLFNYPPLNRDGISLESRLRPFIFKSENTLLSYNGVTVRQKDVPSDDPFNSKRVIKDVSSPKAAAYIKVGPARIVDDVIRPFATAILRDLESRGASTDGWDLLMKYESYSTRAYMALAYKPSQPLLDEGIPYSTLPTDVINWMETFDNSTGSYDRAFAETVLEAIAFGWDPNPNAPATDWRCVDGGSVKIADDMYAYLSKKHADSFTFNCPVTAISSVDATHVEVTGSGGRKFTFSSVICTIPLPVLRTLDLSGARLSAMQSAALRHLNYGPSVKIGMQFRSAWWTNSKDKDGKLLNIVGGQSYTDRPLRTIVYPSFGKDVQAGSTTTLIASYTWTDDATRLGALVENERDRLRDLVLRELAYIHNVTYDFLRNQLIDSFAWSWDNDPYTMGAFAFFGPGKFVNLYKSLNAPAGGDNLNILFAGEALSVRHAWVEGALDSAWKAAGELLWQPWYVRLRPKFVRNWGVNPEWVADQKRPTRKGPDGEEETLPPMPEPEWSEKSIFDPQNSLLYRVVALYQTDST